MRTGRSLLVAWLVIGGLAAGQRHYYTQFDGSCGMFATIGMTVISGPLNYAGLHPSVTCRAPQPTQ